MHWTAEQNGEPITGMETSLVFVWSPGRCGTGYLAKMLQTIPGIVARHEPPPQFSMDIEDRERFWREEKLPAIEAMNTPIYIETSHVFPAFLPSLWAIGEGAAIIQIKRDHRDVALSYWRRRSIPGRSGRGKSFLLQPDFDGWRDLTDYQLCYWHSREIERWANWASIAVDTWLPIEFDALVNGDGFRGIVAGLDLPEPNWMTYAKRRHWTVNGNPENYYQVVPDGDLSEQESEVIRRTEWQRGQN